MKKVFLLFFSFLTIFTLASCFESSGGGTSGGETVKPKPDTPTTHVCEFGEWYVVETGDCYKKGREERKCTGCETFDSRETDYVHNYTSVEALAATCSAEGHTAYEVCINCNKKVGYQTIEKLEHATTHWVIEGPSYHSEYCDECGENTEHYYEQHNFDEGDTTPATCTENGKTVYTCQQCDYYYEEIIYSQGHVKGAEATCTTDQICTVCEEILKERIGHTLLYGTCEEDVYCSTCKEKVEDAKGHVSSGEANCTEHEYCTVCNDNIEYPHHTFVNNVCTECNELELTAGLILELDFDTEYFYRVLGIETSTNYVVIPNVYNGLPVKEIDVRAFEGDELLEKVYIPSNVSYIGEKAFYNCPNLTGIFFEGTTKPSKLEANWNGIANLYYKGDYSVSGNVVTLTLEDTTGNRAYDTYVLYLENLADNYTLSFNHGLTYVVTDASIINTGTVELKASGNTRYATEELYSSITSGSYSDSGITDKTVEYYNDGYVYSCVYYSNSTQYSNPTKSYCTLPITRFIKDSLTIDVVTPSRDDFAKAEMVTNEGVVTITLSTANGYTAEEISSFINYDKIALNMDVSSILAIPGATASVVYTINTTTGAFSVQFEMGAITTEGDMSYTNNSYYTNVGTTAEQICADKANYTEHVHNGETNTCGEVVCKSCKLVIKEASDHTFETKDCESNKCTVCGEVVETGKHHIYSDGECIYCGVKKASANLEFKLSSDGTYYILTGIGSCGSKNIVIPSTYEGLPVKSINYAAFDGSFMTSLYIPSSIVYYQNNILGDCTTLESLTIENLDNITKVNTVSSIFGSGLNNVKEIIILGGTTIKGFSGLTKLEIVVLPDTATVIGSSAFSGCTNLSEINLPESLTEIGSNAFSGCIALEEVIIPSNVTTIGNYAFDNTGIKELTLNIEAYNSRAFEDISSTIEVLNVTGTGALPSNMFEDAVNLTTVTLANTITGIGESAFAGCTNLKAVTIPEAVTTLSESVFENCSSLESVNLSSCLTLIGKSAFVGCTSLKSINLPATLSQINASAFKGCTALEEVVIPSENSLTSIYSYAFADCTALTETLLFEGIKNLGGEIYRNTSVTKAYIPASLSTSYNVSSVFKNCHLTEVRVASDTVSIYNILADCVEIDVIIYEGTNISECSLNECELVKKVIINETVETIEYNAFYGCTALEEVEIIGSGLKHIGNAAFYECPALTTITLPSSLLSIDAHVFSQYDLLTVYFNGTIDDWCHVNLYPAGGNNKLVYNSEFYMRDADGEYQDVKTVTELTISDSVETIGSGQFNGFTALEKITLPSLGDKMMADYFGYSSASSYEIPESLKEIVINGGTTICDYMFKYLSSVEEITIADTITTFGRDVLYDCINLKKLTIPFVGKYADGSGSTQFSYLFGGNSPLSLEEVVITSATTISSEAFANISNVKKVTLLDGITEISNYAFYRCTSLTEITIPASVTTMGTYVFDECTELTKVTFEEGSQLTNIGQQAFYQCSSLRVITIPKSVTTIGVNAFAYTGLETVEFEEEGQLTNIGQQAFYQCSSLRVITIPKSVTTIGVSAFGYTGLEAVKFEEGSNLTNIESAAFAYTGIESITIPSSVESIGYNAFYQCNSLTTITIPFVGATLDGTSNTHFGYIFGVSSYRYHNTVPSGLKEVIITGGTTIAESAFYQCSSIESITIPSSVESIGDYAFYQCGIKTVTIPSSVTALGAYAFKSSSVESVKFAEGSQLTTISFQTFAECASLTSVVIAASVQEIKYRAFYNCTSLSSLTFEEGSQLTTIGGAAFSGCTGIESIVIPSSVTYIDTDAFYSWGYGYNQTINFEVASEPESWSSSWDSQCYATINWGYVAE